MEYQQALTIIILLILSSFATFFYLMKNSAIYPGEPLKIDEDESILKNFLIGTIALIIIIIICYFLILTNYIKIVF